MCRVGNIQANTGTKTTECAERMGGQEVGNGVARMTRVPNAWGQGKECPLVEIQGTRKIGEGDVKPLSAFSCTHRKLKSGERKSSMSHSM